jgi:hypothetical protein
MLIGCCADDRSQVAVALKQILEKEYPQNWPDLVPKVMSFINTQDIPRLHGALYTMRIVIKKYEHKPSEGGLREPLNQIVQATFPTLLQLYGALAKHDNLEACLLQRLLTKIFWSATQVRHSFIHSLKLVRLSSLIGLIMLNARCLHRTRCLRR